MKLFCSRCGRRLSRKTARQIGHRVICSACLFPPLKAGLPQGSSKPFPSCNVPRCDNPAIQDDLCRKHLEEHRDNGGVS